MIFKVDFSQAYNCINWDYLREMLRKFGFGSKWMETGVFSSTISVLINGSPMKDFLVGRGLGQGDSLSPFLFAIATEGLAG